MQIQSQFLMVNYTENKECKNILITLTLENLKNIGGKFPRSSYKKT